MDGDVVVNRGGLLEACHLQGVSDAARRRVELVVFEGDDFAHSKSRIDTQGEQRLVTSVSEQAEEIADLVLGKNSGLTWHVSKTLYFIGFVHYNSIEKAAQARKANGRRLWL